MTIPKGVTYRRKNFELKRNQMLKIENLHATVGDTEILKGLSLELNAGEIHAIMGPNGAGKSTLAYALGGRDNRNHRPDQSRGSTCHAVASLIA